MLKKILIGIAVVLIVIQFFPPKKNTSDVIPATDFIVMNQPPGEVAGILKTSCYDCHSNNTEYPWYNKIVPVSYFLANHVNEGKEHLNFSEWGSYNTHRQEHALEEISEEVEERHMPLTSYISMHKEAALSDDKIKLLNDWIKTHAAMSELHDEMPE